MFNFGYEELGTPGVVQTGCLLLSCVTRIARLIFMAASL